MVLVQLTSYLHMEREWHLVAAPLPQIHVLDHVHTTSCVAADVKLQKNLHDQSSRNNNVSLATMFWLPLDIASRMRHNRQRCHVGNPPSSKIVSALKTRRLE